MEQDIFIPKIDNQTTHCRLLEWRMEVGDRVDRGEILLVFETQKASVEFESPVAGILIKILVASGDWMEVSSPVAVMAVDD
jgi:pyruvate/2-oxoglutarate dehydrogenase complex dihydrolipoamide acyltransferase (E2) component